MRVVLACSILVALGSGCMMPGPGHVDDSSPSPSPTADACNRRWQICPIDRSSIDYQYPLEMWGLHQVTYDMRGHSPARIQGDWIVWQTPFNESGGSGRYGNIYAFDIGSEEIRPVEDAPEYHSTLPWLSHGRVVYSQAPRATAPDSDRLPYMVVWDSSTGQKTAIETGFGGSPLPYGFDGDWVLFRNRGSNDYADNGLWVVNVATNETVKVFNATTRDEYLAGAETIDADEAIAAGRVFFFTDVREPASESEEEANHRYRIREFDVHNQTARVLLDDIPPPGRIEASERYLVWEQAQYPIAPIHAYNLTTGTTWILSEPGEAGGMPSVGGAWATFFIWGYAPVGSTDSDGVFAVNLETGERIQVFQRDETVTSQRSWTDGERFVGEVVRKNRPFEGLWGDLYWGWLPGHGPEAEG